jgi:hypothetical protein
MHIVMVAGAGLVALTVFYFGARMVGISTQLALWVFIAAWFVASILNGMVGVYRAGFPVLTEVAAFVPSFGIPAAVALYLIYRAS